MDFDIGKLLGLDKIEKIVTKAEKPPLEIDTELCLRARGGLGKACSRCLEVCPTEALSPEPMAVDLDAAKCVECGICIGVCPAGALSGKVGEDFLAAKIGEAAASGAIEFACAKTGYTGSNSVLVSCLGRLNLSHLVSAAALGAGRVFLRVEACAECEWKEGLPDQDRAASAANRLLSSLGSGTKIVVGAPDSSAPARRASDGGVVAAPRGQKIDTGSQVGLYSRRDFFLKLRGQAMASGARAVSVRIGDLGLGERPVYKYRLPRSRELLLAAIKKISKRATGVIYRADLPFGQIRISEECIFCRNCTTFCPTGALTMSGSATKGGGIDFSLSSCTMCGLCETVCPPKAVSFANEFDIGLLFESRPVSAIESKLYKCKKCGQEFASVTEAKLCGFCKLREEKIADDSWG